jgi:EpsI family protein
MASVTGDTLGKKATTLTSLSGARNVALVFALLALATLAYWPASEALYELWTDFRNLGGTHGFLVLAISCWLIFRSRDSIAFGGEPASPLALIALLLAGVAWVILWRAGLQDAHVMLVPAILWLGVLAAFGRKTAIALALPIGYLYFASPGWAYLASPLQALTTRAVGLLGAAFGVPIYIEGNSVSIPEGTFDIEGGCSGVHFLTVGVALAVLQGEMMQAPLRRRAWLVAVMVALSILCNWIRVFTIVMAGHLTDMQHFLIKEHYTFGWALFAVIVGTFIWITARPELNDAKSSAAAPAPATHRAWVPIYASAALVMVLVPMLGQALAAADARSSASIRMEFPVGRGGWSGPAPAAGSNWGPRFPGADILQRVTYRDSAGNPVEVAVIVYRLQQQGAELVGDSASLLGDNLHSISSEEIVSTWAGKFRELIGQDNERSRFLVRYRYDIGGRQFVEPLRSQLWYGVRSLGGAPYSALLAYGAACETTCDTARNRVDGFLAQMAAEVETSLPQRSR